MLTHANLRGERIDPQLLPDLGEADLLLYHSAMVRKVVEEARAIADGDAGRLGHLRAYAEEASRAMEAAIQRDTFLQQSRSVDT